MERQGAPQQTISNLPPNVFIQYTQAPATSAANGEKSYYKLENIPFQPISQPISLINQPCLINQNNGGQTFQTAAVINNPCVTATPANYVQLSTGAWNHGIQQSDDQQMIYQIMYPIIDNSGGQPLEADIKPTTVDANVLTTGTCAVLAPAKGLSKKQIQLNYNIIPDGKGYTDGNVVAVEVIKEGEYMQRFQVLNQQHGGHMEEDIDEEEEEDVSSSKAKKKKKPKVEESEEEVLCNICGEKFKSKGSLRFHMFHHNPKAKLRYQCIGCSEGFEKEKQKQEHELMCTRNSKMQRFECCFCDLPFDTPKSLRKHENKHRPIRKTKRYRNTCVCIECNKAFDAIYSLKVHMQKQHKKTHVKPLEDKPFQCSECGLGFKYERSKLKHEFKAHMKQEAATL